MPLTTTTLIGVSVIVGLALPSILTRFTRLSLDLLALAGIVVGSVLIGSGA